MPLPSVPDFSYYCLNYSQTYFNKIPCGSFVHLEVRSIHLHLALYVLELTVLRLLLERLAAFNHALY